MSRLSELDVITQRVDETIREVLELHGLQSQEETLEGRARWQHQMDEAMRRMDRAHKAFLAWEKGERFTGWKVDRSPA